MQKFYKYFTLSVLSLTILWLGSWFFPVGIGQTVEAQNKNVAEFAEQNVYVLEDNASRTLHLVYDLERGKVHLVNIQKTYSPMVFTVTTKNIGQP